MVLNSVARCWEKRPSPAIVVVVIAAGFCYFLNDGISFAFGIIYSDLRENFNDPAAATAVLPAMVDAVPQFSAILTCPFVQAVGSGPSAAIGSVMVSLGFFVSTFVHNLLPLYFTIGVLSAVGLELVYVAALGAVTTITSTNRGFAVGVTVCCSSLGTVFFSFVLPLLLDQYFWAGTFLVVSGFFLNILLAAVVFHYQFDKRSEVDVLTADQDEDILIRAEDNDSEDGLDASDESRCLVLRRIWRDIVRQFFQSVRRVFTLHMWGNVKFLAFIFNEFLHGMTMVIPESLLYDHLISAGFEQWKAATIQAIFSAFSTVGHLAWGVIADRLKPINVYCFAQLFTAVLIVVVVYVPHFEILACVAAVFGFFRGYNETLYSLVIIEDLGADYFYAGLVVLLTVVGAGNMIGTPVGGYIFDTTNSYSLAFVIAGCILTGSTVILLVIRNTVDCVRRQRSASQHSMSV